MTLSVPLQYLSAAVLLPVLVFASLPVRAQEAGQRGDADTKNATEEEIAKWVRDLNSDLFLHRELATERLIVARAAAIDPIVQALATNNLEVTTRGVYILQELALQSDLETSETARAALEKVAAPRATSAARRATEALARLDSVRHERALDDLKRLGAVVAEGQSQLAFQLVEQFSIEIGENWRGKTADLLRLRWLRGVDQIVLNHPDLGDEALTHVAKMESLPALTIRKAKITERGIRELPELKGLQTLSILYCPISDEAVEKLVEISSLSKLRLYGTALTAEGEQQLVKAFGAGADVRPGGAFLGIGCDPTQAGCVVFTVRPETAAEKAGLMVGDLIETYEGKQVNSFEELTAAIAVNAPGDTVSLKIVRGTEQITKKLTLGAWKLTE